MGEAFLEYVTKTLFDAGIRVAEDHVAGKWTQLEGPVAVVGLRDLDFAAGQVLFQVQLLSPRSLGGWKCQTEAANALAVLDMAGMTGHMGAMEYLQGSDCFSVTVEGTLDVVFADEWYIGRRWELRCNDVRLEGVECFRAVRDQGRRIIGAVCQSAPVGVTPGHGGWEIELVQWVREESDAQTEPFTLTLRDKGRLVTFTGCRWNTEEWDHQQRGLRRTRRGFALKREEVLEWIS